VSRRVTLLAEQRERVSLRFGEAVARLSKVPCSDRNKVIRARDYICRAVCSDIPLLRLSRGRRADRPPTTSLVRTFLRIPRRPFTKRAVTECVSKSRSDVVLTSFSPPMAKSIIFSEFARSWRYYAYRSESRETDLLFGHSPDVRNVDFRPFAIRCFLNYI